MNFNFRILVIPFLLLGSTLPLAAAAAEDETIAVAPAVPSEVTRPGGKGDGKRGQGAREQRFEQLEKRVQQLDQRLQLTAAQKEQVKEIWSKQLAEAKGAKGAPKERGAALMQTRDEIRAILTPEQKAKFDKMPAEGRGAKVAPKRKSK